jgi:hypothetical protein
LAVIVAFVLARDGSTRELSLAVSLVIVGIFALIAEFSSASGVAQSRKRLSVPEGARPADGLVEIIEVSEIEGIASSIKPLFRRFIAILDQDRVRVSGQNFGPMLGKIALVSVFVGKDGVGWSESEMARGLDALENAGLWIEHQASRHEAPLNVGLADVYFAVEDGSSEPVEVAFQGEGDETGPMESHAQFKAIVMASRAASSLGFMDVADWISQINGRIEADSVVWLFHVRQAGRSFAIPGDLSEIPGVGFAICYAREASFPEPLTGQSRIDPTTVAHELLHLFGASDKYGVALQSFPMGTVGGREIMRLNHDSLSRMTVGRLTAFEIGWLSPMESRGDKKNARRQPD